MLVKLTGLQGGDVYLVAASIRFFRASEAERGGTAIYFGDVVAKSAGGGAGSVIMVKESLEDVADAVRKALES